MRATQSPHVSRTRCSTKWCTADAGPPKAQSSWRSRFSSASLHAALRPGHTSQLSTPCQRAVDHADGIVDAVDYTVWRNTFGQSRPKGTDADHDYSGVVDAADYLIWKENYGGTPAGSGGLASFGVPEPASGIMLLAVLLGASLLRPRVSSPRSWE